MLRSPLGRPDPAPCPVDTWSLVTRRSDVVSQGMVLSVGIRVAGRANGTTVDEGGGSSPCAGLVLADLPQVPPSTVAGVLRASSVPGSPNGEPTRLRPPRWDSLDALEGQRVVDDVCSREHGVRAHAVPLGTPWATRPSSPRTTPGRPVATRARGGPRPGPTTRPTDGRTEDHGAQSPAAAPETIDPFRPASSGPRVCRFHVEGAP